MLFTRERRAFHPRVLLLKTRVIPHVTRGSSTRTRERSRVRVLVLDTRSKNNEYEYLNPRTRKRTWGVAAGAWLS